MTGLVPVILCGGSGTRLWPLSRRDYPKQFAVELDGRCLLDHTVERVRALGCAEAVAVTAEAYRFMVADAFERAGLAGEILLEPVARNTCAAVAAAALRIARRDPDAVLAVLPSDHHVPDLAAFAAAVGRAAAAARAGWWVTLGIAPERPATAYGYIRPAEPLAGEDGLLRVAEFVEKPDDARAHRLVADGCLWNAGIFVVAARTALASIAALAPDVYRPVAEAVAATTEDRAFRRLGADAFASSPSVSIDTAVIERESRLAVLPYAHGWSDLGSWDAVAEVHAPDPDGNRAEGDARFPGSTNSFVYSPQRLTVALGLDDVVIVDTPDALLVARRDAVGRVKAVVEELQGLDRKELVEHRKVARPWGSFEAVDRGERYQVKRIVVRPGARLSLQYHRHRAEHWVVVKGTARVTCDERTFLLRENESTFIPVGSRHRLENPGSDDLELIEVQSGAYLGEDDIVRLDDAYGRQSDAAAAPVRMRKP